MGSDNGRDPRWAMVTRYPEIRPALDRLGIVCGRPVLVVVGGAADMTPEAMNRASTLLSLLAETLAGLGAVVVDGGTDTGVMAVLGQERAHRLTFDLVGVAPRAVVALTSSEQASGAPLEPHHTGVLLTPGTEFGDESPWIVEVAAAVAREKPSLTLLVNGGRIAFQDVEQSLAAGRRVVVLDGSGRAADEIARATRGEEAGHQARSIAGSPLLQVAHQDEPHLLLTIVRTTLSSDSG